MRGVRATSARTPIDLKSLDAASISDAVDTGLRIIAGADQSEIALRRRLNHRGYEPAVINSAIAKLRDNGYLNNSRLAQSIGGEKDSQWLWSAPGGRRSTWSRCGG